MLRLPEPESGTVSRLAIAGNAWLVATLCAAAWLTGCRPPAPLAQRVERDLLQREKAALERELARDSDDEHETGALVVVPATVVRQLIDAALPVQTTVADRFRITADSAAVDFRGGLALVRLSARVEWVDRESVAAAIEVLGALQILDIQESAGTLAARVEILGFQTQALQLGTLSGPAARLLDEFAERPASDLNALLNRLEIPVSLVQAIRLPMVEEDEISIAAVDVPISARLHGVSVGAGRLWVHIDIAPAPAAQ
jgi:hypothetical protein